MKITLKELSVCELSRSEAQGVSGGMLWEGLLVLGIKLLIDEWPTTKQAAVDAWNGNYNSPQS